MIVGSSTEATRSSGDIRPQPQSQQANRINQAVVNNDSSCSCLWDLFASFLPKSEASPRRFTVVSPPVENLELKELLLERDRLNAELERQSEVDRMIQELLNDPVGNRPSRFTNLLQGGFRGHRPPAIRIHPGNKQSLSR